MNTAHNTKDTPTSDLRVGRRIHCVLYGGKDGTIIHVQSGLGNSHALLGDIVPIVSGSMLYIDVVWDNGTVNRQVPERIATSVQWFFLNEADYAPAQIEAALNHAEITADDAEAARIARVNAFEKQIRNFRANQDYAHFEQTPVGGGRFNINTLAAKNIRKLLKREFPSVKFSVRKNSSNTITVSWSRGVEGDTVNRRSVTDVVAPFKTGRYDAYEDYHSSSESAFNVVFGGCDYIFCQSEIGSEASNSHAGS